MNQISELTKRDIFDLFQEGITINKPFVTEKITYLYVGRINELDFLKRVYDLESLPSYDHRFSNAEGDIWQHTINNDDYQNGWVFEDERFQLKDGDDLTFLKFLCEVFHPEVRYEKGYWKEFLNEINNLLQHDGYELYPKEKISNRDVYGWKLFESKDEVFVPFSLRNKNKIKHKQIRLSIKREVRMKIYKLFELNDFKERMINETGWQYEVWASEKLFQEIEKFYTPKCYNSERQYVVTDNLKDFILFTSPYNVIDAIEIFDKYRIDSFTEEINTIFNLNDISLRLVEGKVENGLEHHIKSAKLCLVEEPGLKKLLQEANQYYEKENINIAVEKLWDAFERLKTYYFPHLDKKKSVYKIIEDVSGGNESFKELFNKEFLELTNIGNGFRIRHHETSKVDIEDLRHYEYFYKRCLSLITTVLQYLDTKREI